MRYRARIVRTISIEFEFDEDEIEAGDSPEIAAEELAIEYWAHADEPEDDLYLQVIS